MMLSFNIYNIYTHTHTHTRGWCTGAVYCTMSTSNMGVTDGFGGIGQGRVGHETDLELAFLLFTFVYGVFCLSNYFSPRRRFDMTEKC